MNWFEVLRWRSEPLAEWGREAEKHSRELQQAAEGLAARLNSLTGQGQTVTSTPIHIDARGVVSLLSSFLESSVSLAMHPVEMLQIMTDRAGRGLAKACALEMKLSGMIGTIGLGTYDNHVNYSASGSSRPSLPPAGASEQEVASWWENRSDANKQWLIDNYPEKIGNLNGVDASRERGAGDAHMTLMGHSYGSTTSGKAAALVNEGVVDDIVLAGSPGAGVQKTSEYHVPQGHAWVSAAPYEYDLVQGLGTDVNFGKNPDTMPGFNRLSGDVGPPPEHYDPFGLHMAYFDNGTQAQREIAGVIAGAGKRWREASTCRRVRSLRGAAVRRMRSPRERRTTGESRAQGSRRACSASAFHRGVSAGYRAGDRCRSQRVPHPGYDRGAVRRRLD